MARSLRATVGALLIAFACSIGTLGWASSASAWYDHHFCGFTHPGGVCYDSGLHAWEIVRTRYPGPQAHNVYSCAYMWNQNNVQIRGGSMTCGFTWDTHYVGQDWGYTSQPQYNARNYYPLSNCCGHTIVGYARTS